MNKINFYTADKFPMFRSALQKMQESVLLMAKLTGIGGNSYILDGCTDNGSTVSAGTIVIDGEILPFAGGVKKEHVAIIENRITETALGVEYPEIYIERTAAFSDTGTCLWSSLKRVPTMMELFERLNTYDGVPVGTIVIWCGYDVPYGAQMPENYMFCDGTALNSNEYPKLFSVIGTQFGDKNSSFRIPNLQGRSPLGQGFHPDYDCNGIVLPGGIAQPYGGELVDPHIRIAPSLVVDFIIKVK